MVDPEAQPLPFFLLDGLQADREADGPEGVDEDMIVTQSQTNFICPITQVPCPPSSPGTRAVVFTEARGSCVLADWVSCPRLHGHEREDRGGIGIREYIHRRSVGWKDFSISHTIWE